MFHCTKILFRKKFQFNFVFKNYFFCTETKELEPAKVRRKILSVAVSSLLVETGFDAIDNSSLETLTEIIQSCKYSFYINFKINNNFLTCFSYF